MSGSRAVNRTSNFPLKAREREVGEGGSREENRERWGGGGRIEGRSERGEVVVSTTSPARLFN